MEESLLNSLEQSPKGAKEIAHRAMLASRRFAIASPDEKAVYEHQNQMALSERQAF